MAYDYKKAVFIVNTYNNISEVETRLVLENGEENYISKKNSNDLLSSLMKAKKNECKKSFSYGIYQAFIYGGAYTFFGPLGLVYWTTPIVNNKKICGGIVCGPVLLGE